MIFNILFDLRIDLSDVTNLKNRMIKYVKGSLVIWIRNMNENGRHQRIGGFCDVDIAKDGESQLNRSRDNLLDTTGGARKKIPNGNNP